MSIRDIVSFDWDKANQNKSMVKHGVTWFESEQIFFNEPLFIDPDIDHSFGEDRFHALGRTHNGRLLFLSFTIRKGFIRIISARPMNKRERKIYEENFQKNS